MLSVQAFGTIVFFHSSAILLTLGTDCGLTWQGLHELTRLYGQRNAKDAFVLGFNRVASLRLALACLLAAAWWITTYRSEFMAQHRWLLLAFAPSFFISAMAPEWVLIAAGQTRAVVVARVLRSGLFFGLVVTLVALSRQEAWVGVGYSLALAVSVAYLLLHFRRHWGWTPRFSLHHKPFEKVLIAVPYFATTVAGQLFFLTAFVTSGWFVNSQDVGLYAAGYRFAMGCTPLTLFFVTALMPAIGSLSVGSVPTAIGLLIRCWASIALPLAVVGAIEGGNLLGLVLGPAYAPAGPCLGILLYGLPILGVALLAATALNHLGRTRVVATVIVLSTLLQIPLAEVATRVAGPFGVAIATDTAILLCAAVLCAMIKGVLKECGVALLGLAGGALAMQSVLTAMVSWLPSSNVTPRLLLEGLVVLAYFLVLRCLRIDPIALLRRQTGAHRPIYPRAI